MLIAKGILVQGRHWLKLEKYTSVFLVRPLINMLICVPCTEASNNMGSVKTHYIFWIYDMRTGKYTDDLWYSLPPAYLKSVIFLYT